MTFFAPTIVNGLGPSASPRCPIPISAFPNPTNPSHHLGYDSLQANLMTVPPWIFGYCICLLLAWSADTHNARGWHVAASSIVGGIGWLVQAVLPADAYKARYAMLFLCASGAFPSANPLSGWVTCKSYKHDLGPVMRWLIEGQATSRALLAWRSQRR
jgi:hypothetical protein